MIRFSHSANSWQCAFGSAGWNDISVETARDMFDSGAPLWHSEKLIII